MAPVKIIKTFLQMSIAGDDSYDPAEEALKALAEVREAIEAVITALDVPRNRMGKLNGDITSGESLRELAIRYGTPGAQDNAEQAVNVLRAVLEG